MQENQINKPVITGKEQGIIAINDMMEEGIVIPNELMNDLVDLV